MRLESSKTGRKGNLNVATEVTYTNIFVQIQAYIFADMQLVIIMSIRYFKWHLLYIWSSCGKQRGTHWNSIRYHSTPSISFRRILYVVRWTTDESNITAYALICFLYVIRTWGSVSVSDIYVCPTHDILEFCQVLSYIWKIIFSYPMSKYVLENPREAEDKFWKTGFMHWFNCGFIQCFH